MKKYKFKYRLRNLKQTALTASTVIFAVFAVIGMYTTIYSCINNMSLTNKIMGYETIMVVNGDTVWDIANNEKYYGYDPRDIMDIIREKNDITGNVSIGQELYIPVMK